MSSMSSSSWLDDNDDDVLIVGSANDDMTKQFDTIKNAVTIDCNRIDDELFQSRK